MEGLSLSRGPIHHLDDLEVALGEGAAHPPIELLNRIGERIFFALFAFVPGMYGEEEERAMARDRNFHERFGDCPASGPDRDLTTASSSSSKLRNRQAHRRCDDSPRDDRRHDGELEGVDELDRRSTR